MDVELSAMLSYRHVELPSFYCIYIYIYIYTGKIEELTNELSRYKWDSVGLSETRLSGCGELTTNEGHKIYYSGREKHQEVVGFIVRKELINAVLNYTTISSRVISIRLKASPIKITIIQIYAPTTTYNDEEIEQFYESVDNTIQESHKKDIIIVQGDFNAKIGSDANEEWAECAGRFGIGGRNDRGQRLLEFAGKHRLLGERRIHYFHIKSQGVPHGTLLMVKYTTK